MSIDPEKAAELARDHARSEYGDFLTVQIVDSPDEFPYGFDPDGWTLFAIVEPNKVGRDLCVGVNTSTGETKSFASTSE